MFSVFGVVVFGITCITVSRFGKDVMGVLDYLVAPKIINPTTPIINVENDDIFLEINEELKAKSLYVTISGSLILFPSHVKVRFLESRFLFPTRKSTAPKWP